MTTKVRFIRRGHWTPPWYIESIHIGDRIDLMWLRYRQSQGFVGSLLTFQDGGWSLTLYPTGTRHAKITYRKKRQSE